MDQAGIIRDLLVWLESHLDQPLSLDNVALKRAIPSGTCECSRKLLATPSARISAPAGCPRPPSLRLTSRPILDIALQYRFDSQQTFTARLKAVQSDTCVVSPLVGVEFVRHSPADSSR